MSAHRIFNLVIAVVFAFLLLFGPPSVLAQAPQPNPGITIDEFPLPDGGAPTAISAGPDGNLWFGEWCGGVISRITTDGTITNFPTSGMCTLFTATGADGNIWFTEPLYGNPPGGYLSRITPSGQLTEIPIPTQNQFDPMGITSSPDGNIWFTESTGGQIVKYTLAPESFTEYPVPGTTPNGITFGPDGNVWFIDSGGHIGKMTPEGAYTLYPIPDSLTPSAIVNGPDGNLWFSERYGGVGKITTGGEITKFSLPSGNGVSGITVGPDGNLWFTEVWNNKIGRITPTGQITDYPIPTGNSAPGWITLGPDGNLWFTESYGHQIGRITLNQPRLTSLDPAKVWIGLKNSDDVGTKFDLLAEVYKNNTLIGSGELDKVNGGSSGFNNAKLNTIPLTLTAPIDWPQGSTLNIKLNVRNTCFGNTHNSGTARLWYNDASANSQLGATINNVSHNYFLQDGFTLGSTPGSGPKKTIDLAAGAPCSPFKSFGSWSIVP